MSLPPELRVLCQQLTSPATSPARLTQSLNVLTKHILQCAAPLSAPQDQKLRDSSSESTVLVHKLKNVLKTLLSDRDHRRRFAGVVLVKAVVDVGGWECLRSSEPWVRGILTVLQKKDPIVSKELVVVTLTSIYTKLHGYQTLVREIATPTIPPFITACLQLLKPSSPDEPLRTPLTVVETITDALATLIPLYPTTTRPSVNQIRSAIRPYLAPTLSDDITVPHTLQSSSRRLAIALHFTAPKAGGADEWSALLRRTVKDFHATADQVFRAVQETWEPPAGYTASKISFGEAPHGGGAGESPDAGPQWTGITAGSQRLSGLLAFMADFLRHPTKAQVSIPVGSLVDTVCRVAQIARHSPRTQTWEQSLEINPSVSRDERDELWSAVPGVHVAALELLLALCRRLHGNFVPLVSEAADYLVRIFKSGIASSEIRRAGYELLAEVLPLCGPTMTKESVDSLELILCACCRDIQQSGGFLQETNKAAAAQTPGTKKNGIAMNADLFLAQKPTETTAPTQVLDASHLQAAETLLSSLLAHLPQRHLKPASRGLLDQTAILSSSRGAMLASVLNPYRNSQGRMYPSIMPFLAQMHPRDQGLEVLRSNMRSSLPTEAGGLSVLKEVAMGAEAEDEDVEMESAPALGDEAEEREKVAGELEVSPPADDATFKPVPSVDEGSKKNPFEPRAGGEPLAEEISVMASREPPSPPSPPQSQSAHKRKIEEEDGQEELQPAKKVDRKTPVEDVIVVQQDDSPAVVDDDSDDESVQLVASFDSDPDSDME